MILEKELQAVSLSTTNKDYYSIWQELLEVAGKLSERWVPESTNESDPGIVLLKVLTACADKLNYNIDKNILEAFMPSATQEESMRKLCEMMGYPMKYYRSATTKVTVSYRASADEFSAGNETGGELILPRFTEFTDVDKEVNYVSLDPVTFTLQNTLQVIDCIEGVVGTCEEENNGIVSINNIDDNYRYYLPMVDIAENGVFVSNYSEGAAGDDWEKVDNLNAQTLGKKCFKFGYDSRELLPYVQFPDDVSSLIEDGLIIQYIKTNGINGNISANTISTFTAPSGWDVKSNSSESEGTTTTYSKSETNTTGLPHTSNEFYVYNTIAAANGADRESLTDAYLNFKKTIGTFDTLVTCRDYMNKIYELTVSSTDTTNLVSNIIVSDIRDDINKAVTICSFNEFGISYIDTPLTYQQERTVIDINNEQATFNETYNAIDNFELVLYPFKKIYGLNNKDEYLSSFEYDSSVYNSIVNELSAGKTISHNLILPRETKNDKYEDEFADIVAIKNYLQLKARITTAEKVNETEYAYILKNIKKAIYENFNARKLDFGEEIPFDSILKVIETADVRIKNVSLDEPVLCTKFLLANNVEYYIASQTDSDEKKKLAKQIYNKLALRNILAGRVSLFNYDTDFVPSVAETKNNSYYLVYPTDPASTKIKYMTSKLEITNVPTSASDTSDIKLKENQIVQFRALNFKTTVTYPAYVNYYLQLQNNEDTEAIPATFITLFAYMNANNHAKFLEFMNYTCKNIELAKLDQNKVASYTQSYGCVFTRHNSTPPYSYSIATDIEITDSNVDKYLYQLDSDVSFAVYYNWIKSQEYDTIEHKYLSGLYRSLGSDQTRTIGKMVDANKIKYQLNTAWNAVQNPFTYFYIQDTYPSDNSQHTADGFGRDAVYHSIKANEEYKLQSGEYLCINYTNGTSNVETTDSGNQINTETNVVNTYYGPGTIIKPNMALISSESKRSSGQSYSKTSGYYFSELNTAQLAGMYSLGANEQIEIRKKASTLVYDNTPVTGAVKIYFKLNNEGREGNEFTWLQDGDKYTLGEGEYFWYTDKNEAILNYFGSGNTIINKSGKTLKKTADATQISTEEILEKGLEVIPWIKLTGLSVNDKDKPGESDRYIQIDEYQYITLIESDTLKYIDELTEPVQSPDSTPSNTSTINNIWQPCTNAKYICDGVEAELPAISVDDKATWEVRTKLAINTSASTKQTLHCEPYSNNGDNTPECQEYIYIFKDKPAEYYPNNSTDYIAKFTGNNLSLKTNYAISSTDDLVQTYFETTSDETGEEIIIDDFKVKAFTNNEVDIIENDEDKKEPLILNNMSEYYTSFTFEDGVQNEKYTTLHCALNDSSKQFGIIMFYYKTASTTFSDNVSIRLLKTGESDHLTPVIFNNYSGGSEVWWSEAGTRVIGETVSVYPFKANALNIVKLTDSCDIEIYCGASKDDAIIFSPLRIVNYNSNADDLGINNDIIDYQQIDSVTPVSAQKQLLDDLRAKDKDFKFFYNAVLDGSLSIDINPYVHEKLSDPAKWYDYNNINNKFVISEIDERYLNKGITLAASSKKPY